MCNSRSSAVSFCLSYLIAATPKSTIGDFNTGSKKHHHLSAEFSMLLCHLGTLFQKCANVDTLKTFLHCYCHPLYPEKLYVDPNVYCDAITTSEIIVRLVPTYINFMDHHLLREIVDRFGNEECKHHYQKYKKTFQRLVRKLRHHPAPVTDDDIEQCSSQKRIKASLGGDVNRTTPQDIQTVQGAIVKATGIGEAGVVYANQDPGKSVIFSFLIPSSCVELFSELCDDDFTILAKAGIIEIQVEEVVIAVIKRQTTEPRKAKRSSSFTAYRAKEPIKPDKVEKYWKEWPDTLGQEYSDLVAMVKSIPMSEMNDVCSESLLLKFSTCIQDWRTVAPFLGMPRFYYEEFTTRHPVLAEQSYHLLLYWKWREGNKATYHHLLETVEKAEEVMAHTQIPFES